MPLDSRSRNESSPDASFGGPAQMSKSQPGISSSLCGSLLPSATKPNDARVMGSVQPANFNVPNGSTIVSPLPPNDCLSIPAQVHLLPRQQRYSHRICCILDLWVLKEILHMPGQLFQLV